MEYKLVITVRAKEEIFDAVEWYNGKRIELGKLFALSVDKSIGLIIRNPFGFARVFKQIRRANSKKFPYSLFYTIKEKEKQVVIFAVIHNSRSDQNWKNRL